MKQLLFISFVFFTLLSVAQVELSGVIIGKGSEALPGATVKVMNEDSGFVTGALAGPDGEFVCSVQPGKTYLLRIIYLSYADLFKTVKTGSTNLALGKIFLKENAQQLAEVEIKSLQTRGEQKGDTTAFNANAFKTNPDATAEDLIKKMPGVTSDNNGVKVNGENVQKILVDGKPFFGDDPNAALKNLPADIIDKVEVFDKLSDQAQFTGFNDGDPSKTINIVTKKGKNVGQFGRAYAGYGTDERYNAGAALNSFKDKRRLSLLLLSNNINQQNFSLSDITGAMGSSGGNNRGGGGGQGGRQSGNSTLLTSPQNGNTATQSAGLNYSDEWGKKITVSGSYFFNYTDNKNHSDLRRNYFTQDRLAYTQTNDDRNFNQNHRANLRFEYSIDSSNKLTLTPSLNFQNNDAGSSLVANNTILDNVLRGYTSTRSNISNSGYDFSNNALFQHKFLKPGRTISLNVNTQLSNRGNEGIYYSRNVFDDTTGTTLDQHFRTNGDTKKISANLSFTEPLNKVAQLQLSYIPSYTEGRSDKRTNDYDSVARAYNDFNTPLSNKYSNVYLTQKGGITYRYRKDKLNFSLGVDGQVSTLKGNQTFPVTFEIDQSFRNILPNAMMNYRFSKTKNIRIYYRSNTNIPSISQLQNVVDISNPLQIKSGNPALKQTFDNNLNIRFGGFNPQTARNAMVFVNASFTGNYISNATYILQSDSLIQGYLARSGTQLTKPVNLDGYYAARGFFVYGFPVSAIKSNLNFNGGITYNHNPSVINNQLNYSNSYAGNAGVFIGSNVSDKLDFSIGYTGNYTIVKNTAQKKSDNNYFSHNASFKINWIFLKGFVINTDLTHNFYNGLSQNFNQEFLLWNAYIGYKFLKNRSLEAKISVFDILNQNRSVGRNVTASYTEDYNTVVLRRYLMFTLTYTFKNFKNGSQPPKNEDNQGAFPNGPPPGMNRHPGPGN